MNSERPKGWYNTVDTHFPAGYALAAALLFAAAGALVWCGSSGCAALPAIEAAAPVVGSIVSLIQTEAQKAQIPPGDPAYQAALAGAQALEARQADAGAVLKAEVDALVLEMHRHRHGCASLDAGAPPVPYDAGGVVVALPVADGGGR